MASPISIFVTSLATAIGLSAAGKYLPAMRPITLGASILIKIDSEMEKAALEAVRNANRNKDGSIPNIVLLTFPHGGFNGSQTKKNLEDHVRKMGGTAWFQTGSNRRVEAFWHHSRQFIPKEAKGCYLGHIVHGAQDGT